MRVGNFAFLERETVTNKTFSRVLVAADRNFAGAPFHQRNFYNAVDNALFSQKRSASQKALVDIKLINPIDYCIKLFDGNRLADIIRRYRRQFFGRQNFRIAEKNFRQLKCQIRINLLVGFALVLNFGFAILFTFADLLPHPLTFHFLTVAI